MARLPYVNEDASKEAESAFRLLAKMGRRPANLYRLLANQPRALEAFLDMSAYIRGGSSLDPGLRELAILATAYEFEQQYEIAHHVVAAREARVPPEKVRAVESGDLDALSSTEAAVVRFSREVARSRRCEDATFAAILAALGAAGAIDLTLTVGWYHLCAVVLDTHQVEIDDWLTRGPVP